MADRVSLELLGREIQQIYASNPSQAEVLVEGLLQQRMGGLSADERLSVVEKLAGEFAVAPSGPLGFTEEEDEVFFRVCELLLGAKVTEADFTSRELLQRLAESLRTIFDNLNHLLRLINITLMGGDAGEKTIRHVILHESQSLEAYLGQIKKAFLIVQEAFKEAAQVKVHEILTELDPEKIAETSGGGLKFGPLRKAELFEIYRTRFHTCRKWFESGRFMEEFLREFEKHAQKLSQ